MSAIEDLEPPLSEQTRRPLDTALRQQRVRGWYPVLDPWWVIGTFILFGAIFVPVGFTVENQSNNVFEHIETYDAFDSPHPDCGINTTVNAGRECTLQIPITQDLEPPILIYYEIEGFHQNHRSYQKSRDVYQLAGALTQDSLSAELCSPLNILGGIRLNPCGLIANTFFNDVISLTGGTSSDGGAQLIMEEEGIAWQSDIDYLFKQPNGFRKEPCPGDASTCCDGEEWSCTEPYPDQDGILHRYFYPDENATQYLYETYPMQISPLDGVLNEHFIVWMRVAALPTFRKLYGWINQPIANGTVLEFTISNNWAVESFSGKKSLLISTTSIFGGRNKWLGAYYMYTGYFCFVMAVLFAAKQLIRPRRLGDKRFLQYKQD